MLENSIWKQYHQELNIHEVLCKYYGCEPTTIIDDEKELYAVLKRKLTKKELRLFIMVTAKISDAEMMQFFEVDAKELQEMKDKLQKKMRQEKMKYALREGYQDFDTQIED